MSTKAQPLNYSNACALLRKAEARVAQLEGERDELLDKFARSQEHLSVVEDDRERLRKELEPVREFGTVTHLLAEYDRMVDDLSTAAANADNLARMLVEVSDANDDTKTRMRHLEGTLQELVTKWNAQGNDLVEAGARRLAVTPQEHAQVAQGGTLIECAASLGMVLEKWNAPPRRCATAKD
jgi:chromosome segregation ATPase